MNTKLQFFLLAIAVFVLAGCGGESSSSGGGDSTPPDDVTDFVAIPGDGSVDLAWVNPSDSDFAGVRIRRSTDTYPTGPGVGDIVYQGTGTARTDSGLANDVTYYYTAFAYDTSSNYAGGANAEAAPEDQTPPAKITGLVAIHGDGSAELQWLNPGDADFAGVTVRHSTVSAPTDHTIGDEVYTGSGTTTTDTASNGTVHYYSVFTYDTNNNYSAGVSVSVTPHVPIVVTFPDANLEAVVRAAISQPAGDIYDDTLAGLTALDASSSSISDLQGLEYCINLSDLDVHLNFGITDAGNPDVVSGMTHLTTLDMGAIGITAIPDLSSLQYLEELYLTGNTIADFTPLAVLTGLSILDLSGTGITDLTPISGHTSLTELDLSFNASLADINGLAGFTGLLVLRLNNDNITNIDALAGLTALQELNLSVNTISGFSAIGPMTDLRYLNLASTGIDDVSPLAALSQLTELHMSNNTGISDYTPLSGLTSLQHLTLFENNANDISFLSTLTALELLYLPYNGIVDISALQGLTALRFLYLYDNNITDLTALVNNSGLDSGDGLNVELNPLSSNALTVQIPALQARGVAVDF